MHGRGRRPVSNIAMSHCVAGSNSRAAHRSSFAFRPARPARPVIMSLTGAPRPAVLPARQAQTCHLRCAWARFQVSTSSLQDWGATISGELARCTSLTRSVAFAEGRLHLRYALRRLRCTGSWPAVAAAHAGLGVGDCEHGEAQRTNSELPYRRPVRLQNDTGLLRTVWRLEALALGHTCQLMPLSAYVLPAERPCRRA